MSPFAPAPVLVHTIFYSLVVNLNESTRASALRGEHEQVWVILLFFWMTSLSRVKDERALQEELSAL